MEARRTISVRRAVAVALGVGLFSVLVPIGVQAVTSSVTISDAKNFSSKARVLKGELQVGGGPLTVIPAAPKVPLWGVAHVTDTNRHQTLAGPFSSSNVFHITSLTFGNVGTTNLQVRIRAMTPGGGGLCDSGSTLVHEVETVAVPAGETVSTPFPTPLVTTGPCLTALLTPPPPTGSEMYVTLVGYR